MKIVILDGGVINPGDLSWRELDKLGDLIIYNKTLNKDSDVLKRIDDAEIVLTNDTKITKEVINRCPNLKYIGVLSTGFNKVDIDAANKAGIVVTNIPTYGTYAVAQFAIALLLEICHNIGHHNKVVQDGKWEENSNWSFWEYPLIELCGKTMGIIGFGKIGQLTAKIAQSLGMNILYYTPKPYPKLESSTCKYVDLEGLLEESDIISLHCPLTESTKGIINKETIKIMKDDVIIINVSRGALIVEEDLTDALNSRKVYAAGLDVLVSEPIRKEDPLFNIPNCIITPHIAWAPRESRERLINIGINNVKEFIEGREKNIIKI